MAIIATGSKTIIDLSDGKSLSAYLGSNQPRVQISDVNAGTYTPDWTTAAGKLVITPVVYANQTAIDLSDSNLTITWKRKTGSGSEAALEASETVSGNILTVTANKLTTASGNVLTYIAYVTYKDPETTLPINAAAQIDFALVTTGEHAKTAWISGEQAFKYDADGNVTPTQITLTANLQNVTMSKWQYKNDKGVWTDYPTTADNASINGTTLIIKPTHAVFVDTSAAIRIVTSDANIGDSTSLYKVSDGTDGSAGAAGQSGKSAVIFALYAPDGEVFVNQQGELTIMTQAYVGSTEITSDATYEWAVYSSGNYVTLAGETQSSLKVLGSDVNGIATYRCTMTYEDTKYTDIITLTDKTDNFQATIESTGGDIFKNTQGNSTLTCRLFQNGTEVDADGSLYVYTWCRMDKDGNPADKNASGEGVPFTATGITNPAKSISITGDHVDVKTTFICNVTKKTEGVKQMALTSAQITICDLADPVVSGTEPKNPVLDMLWMDTSQSPSVIKRWTGETWEVVNEPVVGGTNLMYGTQYWTSKAFKDGIISEDCDIVDTVLTIDQTSTDNNPYSKSCCSHKISVTGGERYMLSFDVSGNMVGTYEVLCIKACKVSVDGDAEVEEVLDTFSVEANVRTYWTRATKAITVPDDAIYVYFVFQPKKDSKTNYQYVKIEEGTVATSWSPAPEDYYEETKKLTNVYSQVKETQTAFENQMNVTQQTITSINGQIVDISEQQAKITTSVNNVTTEFSRFSEENGDKLAWFSLGVDEDYNPQMEIGKEGNPVKMQLTNNKLSFTSNEIEVSYISDNQLYNPNLVVNQSFKLGPFQAVADSSGVSWI